MAFAPHRIAKVATVAIAAVLIGYLTLVPLAYLVWGTAFDADGFTLESFADAYRSPGSAEMLINSLGFAIGSTAVAITIGTFVAYCITRTNAPLRPALYAASLVPLVIPGVLHTMAWILLASPRIGLLNRATEAAWGSAMFDVFSFPGMIFIEGLHLAPLAFLLMAAVFSSIDPALEESALLSGATRRATFFGVTLPLARPGLMGAALLLMVRSLEAFEVPALIGLPAGISVFTSRIWRTLSVYPRDFSVAGAFSLSLLVLTTVGIVLYSRFARKPRSVQTVSGRGHRGRPIDLGRWRAPVGITLGAYVLLAVFLPVVVLVYASTQPYYSVPSWESLSTTTLHNFHVVITGSQTLRALRNSLFLAVGAATLVMGLTAVVGATTTRSKGRVRWMLDGLATIPLVVPGLVMGVALLFVYLRHPAPIYGTIWILLIAYVTRHLPYGVRYSSAAMYQIGSELEESAYVSGVTWWRVFRSILLPLALPGLIAGWMYVAIVSFRELSSSILLYSPGDEVLAVLIWEKWQNGQFTELAALGVLMVLFLSVLVFGARRLGTLFGMERAW